jgi:hypothetical protein
VLQGGFIIDAERAGARGMDAIFAPLDALQIEHLVEQQREGGVGRVYHDGLAANVFVRFDLRAHHQLVQASAAARHDDDVGLGDVDERERIVDAGLGDFEAARHQAVALSLGIRRDLDLDKEAALGEQAPLLCHVERQVLRTGEYVDAHARFLTLRLMHCNAQTADGKNSEPQVRRASIHPEPPWRAP